jgi:xanthine/CO dehydrogenase XdhC/CoxF family maturation factor
MAELYARDLVSELRDVLRAIEEGVAARERMALATIVGVEGSTYRREGARLLLRRGRDPVGTISGGCLEGDIAVAAAEVMESGVARLLRFDLTADDDVVWGWGLGCNGVIDVFVEPAGGAAAMAGAVRRAIDERAALAVITVIASTGEPAPASRVIVHLAGAIEGTLGDATLDERARQEGLRALGRGRSARVALDEGVGAFVEVVTPPLRVVVCGAGHDAIPLIRAAASLGWRIEVLDDREVFLAPGRFPQADRLVKVEPGDAAGGAGVDELTYVVVMSHNFIRDKEYLRSFLGTAAPYIGTLGPRARLERILGQLRREGFVPRTEDLAVVHGPAGLDLGGDGPEEVAWAIVAEILAVHNGRGGGFLKDRTAPIHDRPRVEESVSSGAG